MEFVIKNAAVVTHEIKTADVLVKNGRIAGIGSFSAEKEYDASGCFLMAGFIDTHLHGVNGVEFASRDERFGKALAYEAAHGVTTIAPTTRTLPIDELCADFDNIVREAAARTSGAKIAGIHAEGPFISTARKGAMDPKYISLPSAEAVRKLWEHSGGLFRILSMAPELPGMEETAAEALSHGIKLSMAHTDATLAQTRNGVQHGFTRATHTFNGMRPYNHREPGVIGEALTDSRVVCEAICDFVHLAPETVKLIYGMKGPAGMCLVSDTGMASGLPEGIYTVAGRTRIIKDGAIRLEDGTIAGSCHTLLKGVRDLYSLGIPLTDISVSASYKPAEALGIENNTGRILPGLAADIVLLDGGLNVRRVFIDGAEEITG